MQMEMERGGVAIFISDKIDFKTKTYKRQGHYIMIKGSIHQEDITFIDIYAPNIGALKIYKANINGPKGEKVKAI